MVSPNWIERFYPDGFRNGTAAFYGWLRAHCSPQTVLLNLGAGPATGEAARNLRGEVQRVVGADIESAVLVNDEVDEAHVVDGVALPFANDSFDLVLSDYVLEHVADPDSFLREVRRVVKPGGSFFFRTPNKRHYVPLIARLTPHRIHLLVANRVRGHPEDAHDPWPTYYRLNSARRIESMATRVGFRAAELRLWEAEPSYLMFHVVPFLFGVGYERLVNRFDALSWLRGTIFGRLVK